MPVPVPEACAEGWGLTMVEGPVKASGKGSMLMLPSPYLAIS